MLAMREFVDHSRSRYGLSEASQVLIALFPIVAVPLCTGLIAMRTTRPATLWLLAENHPVELLTVMFLIAGAFVSIKLAARKWGLTETYARWFYAAFAAALFVIAMEEIAWGQAFLHFETPSFLKEWNSQEEFTLHNLRPVQGHGELFRGLFGVGGLIGLGLAIRGRFAPITPPLVLMPWFLVITAHTIVDQGTEWFWDNKRIADGFRWTAELIEMLIGLASWLFVWLNRRAARA